MGLVHRACFVILVIVLSGCKTVADSADAADGSAYDTFADVGVADGGPDVAAVDAVQDLFPADAALDATTVDVPGDVKEPPVTFRTIGGLSMGAAALTVAAHHPDMFDAVAALGGYVDSRYMAHLIRDIIGGGFCPMRDILKVVADDAANGTDEINSPDNPSVDCWLKENERPTRPYEVYMTYNRMVYAKQGLTTFDREFLLDVLGALVYAYGNVMFYNPDHPMAVFGVDPAWVLQDDAAKCANPAHVRFPYNLNAEYNPTGEYDLITFCDGNPDVCRGVAECDENVPDMRARKGWFFPGQRDQHTKPVVALLAVDYNGNGLRDYGEPVVFNMGERWDDHGVDGCLDEHEDGQGGCDLTLAGQAGTDPNGDNFDLMDNPTGTQGNAEYDRGEPFHDYGVDGVDSGNIQDLRGMALNLVADLGEGDGAYTANPRWAAVVDRDARSFFINAPVNTLKRHSFFFDGGIRDGLGALCPALHLAKNLQARGIDVRYYQNFVGRVDSVFPDMACNDMIGTMDDFGTADFSTQAFGKNVLIAYGDPDMGEEAAYRNGSGNHIGNGCELNLRATLPFAAANFGMPDPVIKTNSGIGRTGTLFKVFHPGARTLFVSGLPAVAVSRIGPR